MDNPPAEVTRTSYQAWLKGAFGAAYEPSAFYDLMFDWRDAQIASPLPAAVDTDPDHLNVRTDIALQQTIAFEESGDIEEGIAMGFDVYGRLNVPVDQVLATVLFFCGKPIGAAEGETRPKDSVFGSVRCKLTQKWGSGDYVSSMAQTNGGIVQDLHDDYCILVRGDAVGGYSVFSSFVGPTPGLDTASHNHLAITMIKSAGAGATDFRQSLRRSGQSYKMVGLEIGRRNFAFNASRVRAAEKDFLAAAIKLRDTGDIKP